MRVFLQMGLAAAILSTVAQARPVDEFRRRAGGDGDDEKSPFAVAQKYIEKHTGIKASDLADERSVVERQVGTLKRLLEKEDVPQDRIPDLAATVWKHLRTGSYPSGDFDEKMGADHKPLRPA